MEADSRIRKAVASAWMAVAVVTMAVAVRAEESRAVAEAERIEKAKARRYEAISLSGFKDGIHHAQMGLREIDYARYQPNQVVHIAENLLLFQKEDGSWPTNIDWLRVFGQDRARHLSAHKRRSGSLDNRNTYTQIEYLAKVYAVTGLERYREACDKGIDYLLREQRPSGGWRGSDVEAITFNDDVTVGVLRLLRSVSLGSAPYGFVDRRRRDLAQEAVDRGIRCILACQIRVDGVLTAWCQQHSHTDFKPVNARSFEMASITAGESVGVVRFLMSIEEPSDEIVESVQAAVAWFDRVKITGIRVQRVEAEEVKFAHHVSRWDKVVVQDPDAPPIWARFYDLKTCKPFFCNRGRKVVYSLAEVQRERRTGYAWYGYWPAASLKKGYPRWQQKWAPNRNVLKPETTGPGKPVN